MLRGSGAAVAVLALLCGLWAAPYTHAHHVIDSVRDGFHPHGESLVHTHASPHVDVDQDAQHQHPEPDDSEDGQELVWSVGSFVSSQPVVGHAPLPALLVAGEARIPLPSVWLSAAGPEPTAHGPPIGSSSALRGPPASPPLFS